MQRGNTKRNITGLPVHITYMLVSFIGTALFLYFYVFQVPSLFSLKRFLFSFACSGIIHASVFGMLIYKQKLMESFQKASFLFLFLQAFLLTCYFIIFIPQPVNHLFSKPITLHAEFHNETNGDAPVELLWINNGLRDISYSDIQYSTGTIIDNSAINLPYTNQGTAGFSWYGSAWGELTIVARSNEPFTADFDINGEHYRYSYILENNRDFRMMIPIQSLTIKILAETLLLLSILITACLILFLLNLGIASNIFTRNLNTTKVPINDTLWKIILAAPFVLILGVLILIGLNNRLYSDDYCYLITVRDSGYFAAVKYAFHVLNGRFMSHIANFSIFIWGEKLMPFGMLLSVVITGGSLMFLFDKILDYRKRIDRILFAFILSASILLATYYLAPYLYESAFWSLYTMTVSSGFAAANIAAGLLLNVVNQPAISNRKCWIYAAVFLIWGFISCGFHENISMLTLFFSGCIWVWLFVRSRKAKNLLNVLRLLSVYIVGGILGFGFNVLSSSESRLLTIYQVTFSIQNTIKNVYDLLLVKLNDLYHANGDLGFVVFIMIGIFAYLLGKMAIVKETYLKIKINKFIAMFLFLFPIAPLMISFVPSTFVANYYPNRTFIVPLYFMVAAYFILAFFAGLHRQKESKGNGMKLISIVMVLMLSFLFYSRLQTYAVQFPQFANEWDRRDSQIRTNAGMGLAEMNVAPYEHGFGIDISTTNNLFLTKCYDEYYGIHVIPPE